MKQIEKVVELTNIKGKSNGTSLITFRVYYTDNTHEKIQVKYGSPMYYHYMQIAYPDADFTEEIEDLQPHNEAIIWIIVIAVILLFAILNWT